MAGVEPVEPGHDDCVDQTEQKIWSSTSGRRPRTRSRSSRPRRRRRRIRIRRRSGNHGSLGNRNRGNRHSGNPRLPECRFVPLR